MGCAGMAGYTMVSSSQSSVSSDFGQGSAIPSLAKLRFNLMRLICSTYPKIRVHGTVSSKNSDSNLHLEPDTHAIPPAGAER